MFQKFKCKAKVKTVIDKIVVSPQEHNHLADAATVEATKVFENIRQQAACSVNSPQNILSNALTGIQLAFVNKLSSIPNLKEF